MCFTWKHFAKLIFEINEGVSVKPYFLMIITPFFALHMQTFLFPKELSCNLPDRCIVCCNCTYLQNDTLVYDNSRLLFSQVFIVNCSPFCFEHASFNLTIKQSENTYKLILAKFGWLSNFQLLFWFLDYYY